ncbi:TPA: hypothetical protein HA273_01465 [Candidatus Bathyarchaeota archaeon]|nr:hypothetical protein [Candidatus Bathyarchaeota archaeon]HIJ08909.1 hypothetical protein [Candidatus Bathyarchaeota archaeon]
MKCAECKEEILQRDPDRCPYCGSSNLLSEKEEALSTLAEIEELKKAAKYEDAAIKYEELGMLDKAEEIRKLNTGKVLSISIACPHCSASQTITSKSSEVPCKHCGKNYIVPKKILDLLNGYIL